MRTESRHRSPVHGHAALEVALLSPWIFFLFIGALDVGFYMYALISTQNAARVTAEYASRTPAASISTLCPYALDELNGMPNAKTLTTCTSLPVIISKELTTFDGAQTAAVSVTYRTQLLIPIPGLLTNQLTITRTVQMRTL